MHEPEAATHVCSLIFVMYIISLPEKTWKHLIKWRESGKFSDDPVKPRGNRIGAKRNTEKKAESFGKSRQTPEK